MRVSLIALVVLVCLGRTAGGEPPDGSSTAPRELTWEEYRRARRLRAAALADVKSLVMAGRISRDQAAAWRAFIEQKFGRQLRSRFCANVVTGYSFHNFLRETFHAGFGEIRLGVEKYRFDISGRAAVRTGRTLAGLMFVWPEMGFHFQLRLGNWWRLGLGVAYGMLWVRRATKSDNALLALSLSLPAELSCDIHQSPRWALFLGLRPRLELVATTAVPWVGGLQAFIGARFR